MPGPQPTAPCGILPEMIFSGSLPLWDKRTSPAACLCQNRPVVTSGPSGPCPPCPRVRGTSAGLTAAFLPCNPWSTLSAALSGAQRHCAGLGQRTAKIWAETATPRPKSPVAAQPELCLPPVPGSSLMPGCRPPPPCRAGQGYGSGKPSPCSARVQRGFLPLPASATPFSSSIFCPHRVKTVGGKQPQARFCPWDHCSVGRPRESQSSALLQKSPRGQPDAALAPYSAPPGPTCHCHSDPILGLGRGFPLWSLVQNWA